MAYDLDRLKDDADPEDVANALGLEIKYRGTRKEILCPGHFQTLGKEDRRFGNCVLTRKGYHCFACNRSADVFEMGQDVKGCSKMESFEFVANLYGAERYRVKPSSMPAKSKVRLLSKEEKELLGIKPENVSIPVNIVQDDEDEGASRHGEMYHPWQELQEDPEGYRWLVWYKAAERLVDLDDYLDKLQNPTQNIGFFRFLKNLGVSSLELEKTFKRMKAEILDLVDQYAA